MNASCARGEFFEKEGRYDNTGSFSPCFPGLFCGQAVLRMLSLADEALDVTRSGKTVGNEMQKKKFVARRGVTN